LSNIVLLTPVGEDGLKGKRIAVNLDHVLWMEEHSDGTMLLGNQWLATDSAGQLVNSHLLVAESKHDILLASNDCHERLTGR